MANRISCLNLGWTIGLVFLLAAPVNAQKSSIPKAQIVLFTPSDIEPPQSSVYLPRLHNFGIYAESFFHEGLKQWGYQPRRREIFERGQNEKISVIHVKGDLPAKGDAYKQKWISKQVLGKLREEHNIETKGNLFWIFVYVGDPPRKHNNYRGAGNAKDGGWAVLNYTNLPGEISLDQPVVSRFHDKLFLKGCIHEFGHALGLPHIGPKVELRLGNTLMGPITRIYVGKKMPDKSKAYLSEASAAILSAHPVFTGETGVRRSVPRVKVTAKSRFDRKSRIHQVVGKVESDAPIHRVVILDDRDDKFGAYWVKGFVSEVDGQDRFKVSIPNPNRTGKLKVLAVFKNGVVTGDGKKMGIGSAKLIPYSLR